MKKPQDIVAVRASHIRKDFHLPHDRSNSLKASLVHFFTRDKGYELQHALRDISFEVKKGEFFGIVGRNGSGKSTLLKIIAEIYQPSHGRVMTYGTLVPFIELGVGFNPELTGRENIYLNGALLGFSTKQIDERYDEIVQFAELEEFMDQKLKNYSSGMQVRLAFSVATRAEADILLVDEVLAVGDVDFQRKCYDYFQSLKKNNKTVIFVTHNMSAVKEYCDRAMLIKDGEVAFIGDASMVSDEYLKMFNRNDGSIETTFNDRWGNFDITLSAIKVRKKRNTIDIVAKLTSTIDAEGVVIECKINGADGQLVAGFDSRNIPSLSHLSFRASETKTVTFTFPNILGNGQHTIDVDISSQNGSIIYEHQISAAVIVNARGDDTVNYPIILDVSARQ